MLRLPHLVSLSSKKSAREHFQDTDALRDKAQQQGTAVNRFVADQTEDCFLNQRPSLAARITEKTSDTDGFEKHPGSLGSPHLFARLESCEDPQEPREAPSSHCRLLRPGL
ncbi:hypothetical protein DNTS_034375, partial [Danionella cerebrum]